MMQTFKKSAKGILWLDSSEKLLLSGLARMLHEFFGRSMSVLSVE
jgi:hypothetical protein